MLVFLELRLLLLGTGTAVTFFFARDSDLFFTVVLLFATRRNYFSSGGRERRRVLTFPSGLWLWGFDLNLFLDLSSGGGSLGLGLLVPISRWEDAERDGDAGLKVQIDDFCRRERTFSYNLPTRIERKTRRILWLLFLETKVEKREKVRGQKSSLLDVFS